MNAARLTPRKPIYRCLNAPRVPRTQLRHLSQAETEALLGRSSKSGKLPTPRDYVSVHREQAMRRAAYVKRRNWLTAGALISMTIPLIIMRIWPAPPPKTDGQEKEKEEKGSRGVLDLVSPRPTQADSPRGATEAFQGKKVVVGAGDKILAAPETAENPSAADVDTIELVETGTSYVPYFPRTISLPTSSSGPEDVPTEAEYTLLGLGIRKVSFLRVQVYVVGLYVKTSSLSVLQNHLINTVNPTASALIPGEKDELRKSLLDPEKSSQIWEDILAKDGTQAVDMAWRVVPVRGTDFKHLQDGWMRGITSRTDEVRRKQAEMLRQQAAESKQIALPKPVDENEFSDESFGLAMKNFKQLFQGRGKAPKGSVILLTRDKSGVLGAMYQPIINTNKGEKMGEMTPLGEVRDERVSRLVWLMYLGGSNVSSEDARKNIVDGCVGIVERPVGTVEGMVQ
ncbi:hypothetical protein K491DRAFT_291321 [Lophiostoma macrostomum CBS 122681]|uniref:Chalcone isomerase domain-containing protein n=1 Tax=Lophiostoma macrostomum CBS 122681 TaxID=1314788 RepID=A0A6A6SM80_9PLEO|nr:hypothetical protein K491DRAFT_291321 [Lophiostoma macrostomum CBS 122681]